MALTDKSDVLTRGVEDIIIKKDFVEKAKRRIKVGLILNAFGEKNNIHVHENEIQAEIQKQLNMMPGQEKMIMEYYQKNPSSTESLRGSIYEDKIIDSFVINSSSNRTVTKYHSHSYWV